MSHLETGISIADKTGIVGKEVQNCPSVIIHEMPRYSMEKAAALSGAVLTESSTTAYECARADIPSIFVRTPEQGEGGAFPGYTRIPTRKDPQHLADSIDEMLKNPPQGLSEDLARVVNSNLEPLMKMVLEG